MLVSLEKIKGLYDSGNTWDTIACSRQLTKETTDTKVLVWARILEGMGLASRGMDKAASLAWCKARIIREYNKQGVQQ